MLQSISFQLFAQCTPDINLKSSGIFPAELAPAIETQSYAQIIQFRMPKDTLVSEFGFPILATIDSIIVTKVNGLPANFTYQCNQINCKANGGETGCILLAGLPQNGQQGVYPLAVVFKVYAHALTLSRTIEDSVTRYSLTVNSATALQEHLEHTTINVYPNPANDFLTIESSADIKDAKVLVYDMKMQQIEVESVENGSSNQLVLNLAKFEAGCYNIVTKIGNQFFRNKFVKLN